MVATNDSRMTTHLLSEEEAIAAYGRDNPADDHAIGVLNVASAEHQKHVDEGWKSPEEWSNWVSKYTHDIDASRADTRELVLREVFSEIEQRFFIDVHWEQWTEYKTGKLGHLPEEAKQP